MDGFFISITNNLLEPKHVERMGQAVWLYMYLIDKMTDISEGQGIVNHGNPVDYEMVHAKLGISRRTYARMVDELRDAGYINTMRAKFGLYITINKAKKSFGRKATTPVKKTRSATNGTTENKMRQKVHQDVPKLSSSSATNGTSLYIDNITSNNTKTLAKAKGASAEKHGKPEINEMFEYWEATTGIPISAKQQANRRAAHNLIRKHGPEGLRKLIHGVKLTLDDQYAPRISDFCSLQSKLNELLVWGRKRNNGGRIVSV